MGTFFLTLDASAVYSANAPVLEVLVDGAVVSSITIDSGYGLSSYSFEFAGTYPSTFSLRFNDASVEGGRSVTINNAYINGTNVNSYINQTVLTHTQSATVTTSGITGLFGETDLLLSDLGVVTLQGDAGKNKLIGSATDDIIDGDDDNDNIKSFDGNDQINGGAGNDIIRGGNGNDIILGGDDNDLLMGEDGNDEIYGGNGNDNLQGDSGDDILNGGAGNDIIRGGIGADTLFGGDGNDVLKGEEDNDIIIGGAGTDLLEGGDGDDLLSGGDDNDTLRGGIGADTLFGDAGNDRLFGDDGDDVLDGGSGNDLIEGGIGNDILNGGVGMDLLRGEDGNDILNGGDDNDQLYGGAGNDTLDGGDGWDRVEGEDGDDVLHGGLGNDTVLGGAGVDYVYGDDGNDRVRGGDGNDFVYGGDGNDQVFGDAGDDFVWGGAGNDLVNGNEGDDTLYGESGLDKMFGHEGNDTIYGGDDNDRIYGNEGNDIINGDDGNDVLYADHEHQIVTTTSIVTTSIFAENFSSGSGAFSYSDGGFGGSDPGGSDNIYGQWYTGSGAGSVYVYNNAPNNTPRSNVSGAWNATFNVTEAATNVTLSLDYILYHADANDNGENARIYIEIDGVRYGQGGNDFIDQALGSGGLTNTPITAVTLNLADLTVGTHTISMGLFKTSHNRSDEDSYVIFDNVNMQGDIEQVYTGLNIMDVGSTNIVNGGNGNDKIYGSSGNDILNGDAGSDEIHSGTTTSLENIIDDILANNVGVVYNETTGSFYQFINVTATYSVASSSALSSTLVGLDGVNGYLANITTQAEQDYVWSLTGNNSIWGGGSDSAVEGQWTWQDGSENGTQFWNGNQTGSSVGGLYNNWISGSEPWSGNADYDWFILRSQNSGQWYTENSTATYRYVVEWEASSLINSIGVNILNGGTGADDLYGSVGKEIFVIDQTDAVDDIFNYDKAVDVIDINDVLGYNSGSHALSDFVHFTEVSGNTQISVDTDGLANGVNFTHIATIDSVVGLDLNALIASGNVIVE